MELPIADEGRPREGGGAAGAAPGDRAAGGRPRERADAARNRQAVLEAARRLFAERGVQAVTMSEVARAAGVAKGTVFHRFGDRSGLAQALVDDAERELQERILRGPPPLGPGAPPAERLTAFLDALLTLTAEHRDLLLAVDSAGPSARHRTGAYRAWLQHIALLLEQAGASGDRVLLAHALLAPLSPDLLWHLQEDQAADPGGLRPVLAELARVASA
jgi:AcrR family transcriptional regulator